jgi:hypothetical protein
MANPLSDAFRFIRTSNEPQPSTVSHVNPSINPAKLIDGINEQIIAKQKELIATQSVLIANLNKQIDLLHERLSISSEIQQ